MKSNALKRGKGRPATGRNLPWEAPTDPIFLKRLIADLGFSNRDFGDLVGISRGGLNRVLNKRYLPVTDSDFQPRVERILSGRQDVQDYLAQNRKQISDIWLSAGENLHALKPADMKQRLSAAQHKRRDPAMIAGNPNELIPTVEVEMIAGEAMKHFKLFRNPFIDDIQKDADIYMSEEHRYIEAAMIDAAKHGGFLAVIGEVGSGKSVMRRKVVGQLQKDGDTQVIFPQIIDKTRLNASSICDAIVMDISNEKPMMKLEAKTRQVHRLLLDRAKSGYRACLIIEEAHDLAIPTLKYLKRFYELEDGYKKLLGIVLVGQTELREIFNESTNVDMREVIRRVQVAEIKGLNGHLAKYLEVKFKRVGQAIDTIFAPGAIDMLAKRLTSLDRDNRKVSHAYPLLVNNYVARAMNMAYELDEKQVTVDVVEAI